jgi:release factor glutamine methyltransferase
MQVIAPPGVFSPHSDTWMLAGALKSEPGLPGGRVLDVCTGSGAVAVSAAMAGAARVDAVDVSRRAVLAARMNATLNRVTVHAHRGDLFEPLGGRSFDLIASNPPYLPGDERLPSTGAHRAWEGGLRGRAVIDRLIEAAPERLAPGGALLIVQSSVCGTDETIADMQGAGLDASVVESRTGPLGPLMLARVEQLEQAGLLAPGQRDEEIAVIRGAVPA